METVSMPQLKDKPAREVAALLAQGLVTAQEVRRFVSGEVAKVAFGLCGRSA